MSELRCYDNWKTTPPEPAEQPLWEAFSAAVSALRTVINPRHPQYSKQRKDNLEQWLQTVYRRLGDVESAAQQLYNVKQLSDMQYEELDVRLQHIEQAASYAMPEYADALCGLLDDWPDPPWLRIA